MSIPEFAPIPPFNRNAIYGFIFALLTLLAFCAGILPVPFTVLLCYPPGAVFAIISLFLAVKARRELRTDTKNGHTLALISAWVSGLSLLALVCMITAGVTLTPRLMEYVKQLLN